MRGEEEGKRRGVRGEKRIKKKRTSVLLTFLPYLESLERKEEGGRGGGKRESEDGRKEEGWRGRKRERGNEVRLRRKEGKGGEDE